MGQAARCETIIYLQRKVLILQGRRVEKVTSISCDINLNIVVSVPDRSIFRAVCTKFISFEIEMLFAVVTVTCLDLHVWILVFKEIASDKGDDSFGYTIQD